MKRKRVHKSSTLGNGAKCGLGGSAPRITLHWSQVTCATCQRWNYGADVPASREEQHGRYLDAGPQAWDDNDGGDR